ncbi:hypothetical protein SUGI_0500240 [Cryptomeria japonica]|nr:hypothetical protein SUGI_0500240 [Cryptomeria japonica]
MFRVVRSKDNNTLLTAARPQSFSKIEQTRKSNLTSQLVFRGFLLGCSIRKIKQAVNILNKNIGLFTSLSKKGTELLVMRDLSEFKIVDVIFQDLVWKISFRLRLPIPFYSANQVLAHCFG